ncbi:orexigenic neuropeptide QRFP isoform 1-T2 [Anomaloglossus baeobatrachus]|uniref:orexigenic neuropeptide QRFP n=1 Tax=Anomaloglossus baeobatrachus TaxID=238106 RepID=UPI003F4FFAAF
MRGAHRVSLLLLLVWGCSYSLQEALEDPVPWERIRLWQLLPDRDTDLPAPFLDGPRDKKSTDPASLFSVAKELQGFGKERAGFRFRFGRREEGNEVEKAEPEVEKRSATALGSLAEELNGYNRKKGGFSFRFGR